jgi:NADH:ubiquinone oxidoreductase subunit D
MEVINLTPLEEVKTTLPGIELLMNDKNKKDTITLSDIDSLEKELNSLSGTTTGPSVSWGAPEMKLNFEEPLETAGDSYARYLVRMRELRESLNIIDQLIDNIPEGEFQAKTKAVLKLPKGEFYSRVETARGEFGVYIISEGGLTPYRIHFRSPGFANLSCLNHIAKGQKIGDLVAMMGTLDLVIPDIDR